MDDGLALGLSEGIKGFISTYQAEQDRQDKKSQMLSELALKQAMQKRAQEKDAFDQNLNATKAGYIYDKTDHTLSIDENSPLVQATRAKALKDQAASGYTVQEPTGDGLLGGDRSPDGMDGSNAQPGGLVIGGKNYVKDPNSLAAQKQSAQQQRIDATNRRTALLGKGVGLREDTQANKVGDTFDKDPIIVATTKSQNIMNRGLHTLSNPPNGVVSVQMLKEMSNDIANGLAGAGANAQSDREAQEYHNLATRWAGVVSQFKDAPEGIASPGLLDYVKANMQRLNEGFDQNLQARAKQLGTGRKYNNNKSAQSVLDAKMSQYSKPQGLIQDDNNKDQKVSDYAKQNGLDYDKALKILKARGYGG